MQRTSIDKHQSKVMALTLGAKLTHVPKITLLGKRKTYHWWRGEGEEVALLDLRVTAIDRNTDSITYYTETPAEQGTFDRVHLQFPAGHYIVPCTKIVSEVGDEINFSYKMGF